METAHALTESRLTDEEIVGRVMAGETFLYEIIMRRHNARLYRTVRAIVKNDAEVEDVMQQAYLSAYDHLGQFAGTARFSTWLTRIAVNEAFARGRTRRRFVPMEEAQEPRDLTTPEDTVSTHEMVAFVEQALDAMPDLYSSVLVLREVEGLSTAETASVLDVTEDTVKVRLHRARALLRDAIDVRAGEAAAQVYAFHRPRCDRVVAGVLGRISAR